MNVPPLIRHVLAFVLCALNTSMVRAAAVDETKLPPAAGTTIEFVRDIKAILEQSCLKCHGPEKPKSRFRLDNRADALKGGENGVAIVPAESAKSPMIHMVAGLVEDMEMPPKGKGDPLTPTQIGLLRAWIDQGVVWETAPTQPEVNMVMIPTARWITVSGDEKKFRENHWLREGGSGGVERFALQGQIAKDTRAIIEGVALLDEFKVALTLEKRELGFTRFGWEHYRKYFDDSGGYYPAFDPSIFSLGEDLFLDVGRAWAEFGLTLPNWPRMAVGYEYQYRDGQKSTLQWGSVDNGTVTRNIYPAAKTIDERTHVIRFDLDHEIKGFRIEDTFRGEFYDLNTERNNTRAFSVGSSGPSRLDLIKESNEYVHGANTLRVEKQVTSWWLGSAGYLYSKLDSDARFALDTLFPIGPVGFADRWRSHELVVDRETHAVNATSMFGPWQGLTVSAGILSEWTKQDGFGRANLDNIFPPIFGGFTNFVPVTIASSYDRAMIEESAALRYTGIPFTTLFADARLQQDGVGENEEQQGGPHEFLRETDATSHLRDLRAGFSTSPWRPVSFSSHYRWYEKETDFDHERDQSATGDGYPAFIRWRETATDEFEARLVIQPTARLKNTFTYRRVNTDYGTETDAVSLGAPGDVTPGGRLEAAQYDAHVYSANATLTAWGRLYLSGSFTYQDTRMEAFDNDSPSVVPHQGDLFSVLASANYAFSRKTDLTGTYSFSWADYEQRNFSEGLPLGVKFHQHAVLVGVTRRFTPNVATRLQYGFYRYEEPSSGGANDYTAHAAFASLVIRLP